MTGGKVILLLLRAEPLIPVNVISPAATLRGAVHDSPVRAFKREDAMVTIPLANCRYEDYSYYD